MSSGSIGDTVQLFPIGLDCEYGHGVLKCCFAGHTCKKWLGQLLTREYGELKSQLWRNGVLQSFS
jgi:hypothetical protein